jgi:hypothetical protein
MTTSSTSGPEEGTLSSRGFRFMDPVPSDYGGEVRVSESSSAMGPHLWLRVTYPVDLNEPEGDMAEGVAHLKLDDAARLRDQLTTLIDHHYQMDDPKR